MRGRPRLTLTGKHDVLYIVVHENGRAMSSLFTTMGKAQQKARYDGDTVIAVEINLDREPLFIRRKVLK